MNIETGFKSDRVLFWTQFEGDRVTDVPVGCMPDAASQNFKDMVTSPIIYYMNFTGADSYDPNTGDVVGTLSDSFMGGYYSQNGYVQQQNFNLTGMIAVSHIPSGGSVGDQFKHAFIEMRIASLYYPGSYKKDSYTSSCERSSRLFKGIAPLKSRSLQHKSLNTPFIFWEIEVKGNKYEVKLPRINPFRKF